MGAAALLCVMSSLEAVAGSYVMTDSTIRTAVAAWLSDSASTEAAYGHISTWETVWVTDMAYLFCGYTCSCANCWCSDAASQCNTAAASFNEDIGAWDTSGVTTMYRMFYYASSFNGAIGDWAVHSVTDMNTMFASASAFNRDIGMWDTSGVTTMSGMFNYALAFDQDLSGWAVDSVTSMGSMFTSVRVFDQDLGWCVDDDVDLDNAFYGTQCSSTTCGVIRGTCAPTPVPTVTPAGTRSSSAGGDSPIGVIVGAAAAALLLVVGAFCFYCRSKASMMDKADERSGASSPPKSNPEPTELSPPEEATSPKEATSPAAAKANAAETVERPGFTRKLSSFLFGEQEEEPTAHAVAEAEEAPSAEQPPPPPARRTEPEPSAKTEEMYNQIAAWYNEPANAALRARWGAYPGPEEFQTWPGFVAVTNAFLDREAG